MPKIAGIVRSAVTNMNDDTFASFDTHLQADKGYIGLRTAMDHAWFRAYCLPDRRWMWAFAKVAVLVAAIYALGTLSGCPYDPSAVGLTKVDGGYVSDLTDGGVFLPADLLDADVPDMLSMPPTMSQLCTLVVGDVNDQNDYPKRFGTWIGDVERIIGPPPRNGASLGQKDATLSYLWKGSNGEPAGVTFSFEYVLLQCKDKSDARCSNSKKNLPSNIPTGYFPDSYWLNGIMMRDGSYYDCWRWELKEPGLTPCPECLSSSQFTTSCIGSAGHVTDCF